MSPSNDNDISTLTDLGHRVSGQIVAQSPSEAARQKATREFAAVLAGAVYRVRQPLLLVAVMEIIASIVLLGLAVAVGDALGAVLGVIAVAPLGFAAWLIWQRQELLAATDPMETLSDDVGRIFDATSAWATVSSGLETLRMYNEIGWGPLRMLRNVWDTVQISPEVLRRISGLPQRMEALTPGRLGATATVGSFCLASALLIGALDVIFGVALAAGLF